MKTKLHFFYIKYLQYDKIIIGVNMIELINNKIFLEDGYEIREYETENGLMRALISNESIQSLIYIDKDKRKELGLDYFDYYNIPMNLNPNGSDFLMLGGGAISYPHYYLRKYTDKKLDIVEINEKCIEYAKKYFYLDELIENNKNRLNVIIDDAINYISYTNKQYDYILIDLFNGREPVKEIYENQNIFNLKRILKNNGIIVINYIIENDNYMEELNKIIKISNNYKIIANKKYFNNINKTGNIIIILSNNEINMPVLYEYIDISSLIKF